MWVPLHLLNKLNAMPAELNSNKEQGLKQGTNSHYFSWIPHSSKQGEDPGKCWEKNQMEKSDSKEISTSHPSGWQLSRTNK